MKKKNQRPDVHVDDIVCYTRGALAGVMHEAAKMVNVKNAGKGFSATSFMARCVGFLCHDAINSVARCGGEKRLVEFLSILLLAIHHSAAIHGIETEVKMLARKRDAKGD